MIVDRRKDSYDELVVLARDSHTSRRRASRWTTTLIVSGALASAAYVATINAEMDALDEATNEANQKVIDLTLKLDIAERDRDIFRAQRDVYHENAGWFADLSASKITGDSISNLGDNFPVTGNPRVERETVLSNVVWVVDGSRRFPMTTSDILWIPESNLWVRLGGEGAIDARDDDRNYRRTSLNYGSGPADDSVDDDDGKQVQLGGAYRFYEEAGKWAPGAYGNADCLKLTLHYQSNRPAFASNPDYLDMEVLLYNSGGECPADGRVMAIAEGEDAVEVLANPVN